MNLIASQILSLAKQLFPKGRAFTVPVQRPGTGEYITTEDLEIITTEDGEPLTTDDFVEGYGGWLERFMKAFGGDGANRTGTLERVYSDAHSIYYHIMPLQNNPYFTDGTANHDDNDCNDFEELLGLIQWGVTSSTTPTRLQRMAAIATKMRYPGTDAPRQARDYIEAQLRSAGFDVYVYENLSNLSPYDVLGIPAGDAVLEEFELDELELDETYADSGITVIANHVDEAADADFSFGDNYHGSFFISGNPITTFANVPAIQREQLRQLILSLKPAHMAGFMFVNYT